MKNNETVPERVVIYSRVSSAKQVTEGNGLDSQESRCHNWCNFKNLEVAAVFREEGISGGKNDRPALKKMLDFLSKQNRPHIVLVDDLNRLARETMIHLTLKSQIRQMGHVLQSVNMTLDDTEESALMEVVSSSLSEYERKKNAKRTKERMCVHAEQGFWTLQCPTGYKQERRDKRVYLARHEPVAGILQEALEGFASSRFITQKDVLDFITIRRQEENAPMPAVTFNFVKNLLQNQKYTGFFAYEPWNIPAQKWAMDAIITIETFDKIQERLKKKLKSGKREYNLNDEAFPLRRWVKCPHCGKTLTASRPRGTGGVYPYYSCKGLGCPMRGKGIKPDIMHAAFEDILDDIKPQKQIIDLTTAIAKEIYNTRTKDIYAAVNAKKKRLESIDEEISRFAISASKTSNGDAIKAYEKEIAKLERERTSLGNDTANAKAEVMPFDQALKVVTDFIGNPRGIWMTGNIRQRVLVLNLCFSDGITYDRNKKFGTFQVSPIFKAFGDLDGNTKQWRTREESNLKPSDP